MIEFDTRYIPIIILTVCTLIITAIALYSHHLFHKTDFQRKKFEVLWRKRQDNLNLLHEEVDLENAQQEKFLDALRREPSQGISNSDLMTGNIVIDNVLGSAAQYCQSRNMAFHCKIDTLPDLPLTDQKLSSLFGNLIDNAIAAAEPVQGNVHIQGRCAKGQWILIVENSKSPDLKPLESKLMSTKTSGHHGLGTRIIDSIVHSTTGYINREDKGDIFRTFISIPVEV